MILYITFNHAKINNMNKITSQILIFIFAILAFGIFVFKKDYGYDKETTPEIEPIVEVSKLSDFPILPKNTTINGIDYLQSQLPIGKFGGNFISTIIGEVKTFNPYNASDATSAELSELMYDGLTQTNPIDGKVIPKLAKSFNIKNDKMTYIVHLRKGIKWSDGTEITADDVVFTYDTVIFGGYGDGGTRDVMLVDGKLPTVKKIDDYTVEFKTPKPFAPFLRTLSASILPKHVFEPITKKGQNAFLTFQGIDTKPSEIVYSGPFHLREYKASQRVVFEKNPNYYLINKNNEKLPYLNALTMLIVGDMNNDTLKFESGETDVLSVNGALVNRYRELKKHGDFELYDLGASTNTTFVFFNLNNRKNKNGKYYVNPIKQKWFQDENFRSAVDWAIDRDDLVLNIFSGLAQPLYSAEAINSIFINKNIAKGHKKDVAYAKSLLQKSGFYLKDGILHDKEGNIVEFELLTNAGNTQREATGVSIKQDLEKLGMKVNFKAVEFNSLINKTMNSLDFDCIIIALTSNILEPNSGYNVWTPNGSLHLFNKRSPNDSNETNKPYAFEIELENLFKQGAIELDFNKRKQIYNKYQEIVAKHNPLIYLYAPFNISAIRKKVKNIYPTQLGGLIFDKSQIFIDE